MDAESPECRTICQAKSKETQGNSSIFMPEGWWREKGKEGPYLWGNIKRARVSLWHKQFTIKSSWGNNPIVETPSFAFRFCSCSCSRTFVFKLGSSRLICKGIFYLWTRQTWLTWWHTLSRVPRRRHVTKNSNVVRKLNYKGIKLRPMPQNVARTLVFDMQMMQEWAKGDREGLECVAIAVKVSGPAACLRHVCGFGRL